MLYPLTIDTTLPPDHTHPAFDHTVTAVGLCPHCGVEHTLAAGLARAECEALMQVLETRGRIDLQVPDEQANPHFSLDYLHGVARGQMFGVMICRTPRGEYGTLRAFSAQYNRVWHVAGWVPPLIDVAAFDAQVAQDDPIINRMGREIAALDAEMAKLQNESDANMQRAGETSAFQLAGKTNAADGIVASGTDTPADGEIIPSVEESTLTFRLTSITAERKQLMDARKALSQQSMRAIHELYRVRNFRGQLASLFDIFPAGRGVPTGSGDCCAPKLLQYAALHDLTPLGLAEFYWGRESRSGARLHRAYYPSCKDKCYPILGHMLCGLTPSAHI